MTATIPRRLAPALVVLLAVLLGVAPALSGVPAVAARQQGAEALVRVVDNAFEPGTLTVAPGTTVTWTNEGNDSHTVTADDGSFDSARLDPGESFSVTFDAPGTFGYHCSFHPGMTATIVVSEEATGGAAEPDHEAGDHAAATPAADSAGAGGGEPSTAGAAGTVRDLTPSETPRLAHIHAGNCEELGIVIYSLGGLRSHRAEPPADSSTPVTEAIVGTANVPLADLFGEPFSIHVHQSVEDKQVYLGCADVGSRPADPWTEDDGLVLRVEEQQDSGFSGFATLRPSATGGTDVAIFLAGDVAELDAAASQPARPRGSTYTSPTFGYTLTYGPQWTVTEETSAGGRDRFVLFNGSSYVTFTGADEFGGDTQACLDDFVDTLTADPNVRDLALATDDAGQPVQGATAATGAYAAYNHGYVFPDRVEEYTLYVHCVPLEPNESVLAIVQNVPTGEYNDQIEPREALLRSLALPQ